MGSSTVLPESLIFNAKSYRPRKSRIFRNFSEGTLPYLRFRVQSKEPLWKNRLFNRETGLRHLSLFSGHDLLFKKVNEKLIFF